MSPPPKLKPPVLPNMLVGGACTLALPPNPPKLGVPLLPVLFAPNAGVDAPNENPPLLDCPNPLLAAGAPSDVVPNGLLGAAKDAPNEGEEGEGCGEPTFRLLFAVMILLEVYVSIYQMAILVQDVHEYVKTLYVYA